jgi:hypothetical protein
MNFKTIEILKLEGKSINNIKFEDASILLTGNYLIIIKKYLEDGVESTTNTPFNLSEIKSYKIK